MGVWHRPGVAFSPVPLERLRPILQHRFHSPGLLQSHCSCWGLDSASPREGGEWAVQRVVQEREWRGLQDGGLSSSCVWA